MWESHKSGFKIRPYVPTELYSHNGLTLTLTKLCVSSFTMRCFQKIVLEDRAYIEGRYKEHIT